MVRQFGSLSCTIAARPSAPGDAMIVTIIKCDECGAAKGRTNHWWTVFFHRDCFAVHIYKFDLLNSEHMTRTLKFDLCGEECLQKKISSLLATSLAVA